MAQRRRFHVGGDMLLKEGLAADALRAAHQRQRAGRDMRPDPVPDRDVIFGQIFFGDADVGPIDPIGMGQANAGDVAIAVCRLSLLLLSAFGCARLAILRRLSPISAQPIAAPPRRLAAGCRWPPAPRARLRCAALSSRIPLNDACRSTPPWVMPAKFGLDNELGLHPDRHPCAARPPATRPAACRSATARAA